MKRMGFSDLETLDCQIEGLQDLLEMLYIYTEDNESLKTISGVVYALQTYAECMDVTLQRYINSTLEVKNHADA